MNGPGALTLSQLNTGDPERALEFYSGLFGWRGESVGEDPMPYWGLYNGERLAGGMMLLPAEMGAPAHWLNYFGFENFDDAVGRVGELGGQVMMPAHRGPRRAVPRGAGSPGGGLRALHGAVRRLSAKAGWR